MLTRYRNGSGRSDRQGYVCWTPVRLADPRSATVQQLLHGMGLIVEAEGPVMASRVFNLFARAGGLGRIYTATRKRFIAALEAGLDKELFLAEREVAEDPGTWVLRLPTQPVVSLRSLGDRTMHEVPASELAEVMLEILTSKELVSREELFRTLLAEYDLIRLTEATDDRFGNVLSTYF